MKRWWLDYGHADLFSALNAAVLAVIDANIFFDLLNGSNRESSALQADWLAEAFTLAVTPEVYNEIDRGDDGPRKDRARRFVPAFSVTAASPVALLQIVDELTELLGVASTTSDRSDRRQLAHAISAGATYFVTRDGDLLDSGVSIRERFAIEVVRPSDLVCRCDEDARPSAYVPAKLDGSALTIRRLRSADVPEAIRSFQNFPRGERNSGLPTKLREALATPDRYRAELILDATSAVLGVAVWTYVAPEILSIEVLRVTAGALGDTLLRHAVWRLVQCGLADGATVVQFTDRYAQGGAEESLSEIGFFRDADRWIKVLLRGNLDRHRLSELVTPLIQRLASSDAVRTNVASTLLSAEGGVPAARIERAVWPARLRGAGLPCFVIPIKAKWAAALFDTRSAAGRLFGGNPDLLLSFENAYYRSARAPILTAPARILWYSSACRSEPWAKHLCCTSILNDIFVGTPRALFHELRRYGVFSWSDVASLRPDGSGRVMAFTFSHSALIHKPIPFSAASQLITTLTGKRYTFQSPVLLDEEVWMQVVALGSAESKVS